MGTYRGQWAQVQVQDDLPEAPAQPEGDPENDGLPTATGRLTRSRLERSKRADRGGTPSHRGPTLAVFLGGGPRPVCAGAPGRHGAHLRWGIGGLYGSAWTASVRLLMVRHNGVREVPQLRALPEHVSPQKRGPSGAVCL